jgi:hypothetical protein
MLNITLPDGEVAHLIRIVVQKAEDGIGTIYCTVVRDNWDFDEIPLDQAALYECSERTGQPLAPVAFPVTPGGRLV